MKASGFDHVYCHKITKQTLCEKERTKDISEYWVLTASYEYPGDCLPVIFSHSYLHGEKQGTFCPQTVSEHGDLKGKCRSLSMKWNVSVEGTPLFKN